MKKKNLGLIFTTAIIALVLVATIGIAIFAGVVAIFSDNGEETTAPKTEQVTTTAGDDGKTETEGASDKGETTAPVETTTAADAFEDTETVVFPEIPEEE